MNFMHTYRVIKDVLRLLLLLHDDSFAVLSSTFLLVFPLSTICWLVPSIRLFSTNGSWVKTPRSLPAFVLTLVAAPLHSFRNLATTSTRTQTNIYLCSQLNNKRIQTQT